MLNCIQLQHARRYGRNNFFRMTARDWIIPHAPRLLCQVNNIFEHMKMPAMGKIRLFHFRLFHRGLGGHCVSQPPPAATAPASIRKPRTGTGLEDAPRVSLCFVCLK